MFGFELRGGDDQILRDLVKSINTDPQTEDFNLNTIHERAEQKIKRFQEVNERLYNSHTTTPKI